MYYFFLIPYMHFPLNAIILLHCEKLVPSIPNSFWFLNFKMIEWKDRNLETHSLTHSFKHILFNLLEFIKNYKIRRKNHQN